MIALRHTRFHLLDARRGLLGDMVLHRREDKLLFGTFTPGSALCDVGPLFQQFEEAVNLQALGKVEELDTAIGPLGQHLRWPDGSQEFALRDVQIWSDRSMTGRLLGPVDIEVNGNMDQAPRQPVRDQ